MQVNSQNIENIVSQIQANNLTLKALRQQKTADSTGNRTDIFLQNPDVGINYLFGNPSSIGNRTDFSVIQNFEFPTVYVYRNQISTLKNVQAEFQYEQELKNVIYETKLICNDLIYYNAMINEYSKRLTAAEKIANSYKLKFEIGEANILEYNKAELNKLNVNKRLEELKIEKTALTNQLISLNGNISITFNDTAFSEILLPTDFEQWYAEVEQRNPTLNWLESEIELSEKQQQLYSAMSLPHFSAGYMSELTDGQDYQGITLGFSIPLWENKNKIKYSKLNTEAAINFQEASKQQHYNNLKILYQKAQSLQKNVLLYKQNLQTFNNSELLYKALETGEIDLINYITELTFYYESVTNLLEMERELNKVICELFQY